MWKYGVERLSNPLQSRKFIWICPVCTFDQVPFNGLNASAIQSLWLRDQADSNDAEQCNSLNTSRSQESTKHKQTSTFEFEIRSNDWANVLISHLNILK